VLLDTQVATPRPLVLKDPRVRQKTNQKLDFSQLSQALDIILESQSLAELCQRCVTSPTLNHLIQGAHILLNTDGKLSFDSGYGIGLPDGHLEIAKSSIASQRIEFREESPEKPALIAIPFIYNQIVEAVAILVLDPGTNENFLTGPLESALTQISGFYLATKYGLGN
jgi:hypothetical protein